MPAEPIPPPDSRDHSPYGYVPTAWVCGLFIGLFGFLTLVHLGQSVRYRMWWLIPSAVLAGASETIGWSARYWSSQSPYSLNPYLIQITTTIIAPTPLVAANFIILGKIINRVGPQYSRLSPKWYSIIFISFDFVALVIQAVGGALASRAVHKHNNPKNGGHIMLGGIALQMVAITVYVSLASEFLWRFFINRPIRAAVASSHNTADDNTATDSGLVSSEKPYSPRHQLSQRLKLMIGALVFSTLVIFIRAVYRTIELSDGWTGRIITTQIYFNVLDGAMIVLAMATLAIFHPGVLLRRD